MTPGFWLSHHPADELDRCYRLGGHFICARCLGTYPVLFGVFAFALGQGRVDPSPSLSLGVALVLPAVADWAVGRLRRPGGAEGAADARAPQGGVLPNLWRSTTGGLLGLGLGQSLALHVQRPFPMVLIAQLALATSVVSLVILIGYLRRWGR